MTRNLKTQQPLSFPLKHKRESHLQSQCDLSIAFITCQQIQTVISSASADLIVVVHPLLDCL